MTEGAGFCDVSTRPPLSTLDVTYVTGPAARQTNILLQPPVFLVPPSFSLLLKLSQVFKRLAREKERKRKEKKEEEKRKKERKKTKKKERERERERQTHRVRLVKRDRQTERQRLVTVRVYCLVASKTALWS